MGGLNARVRQGTHTTQGNLRLKAVHGREVGDRLHPRHAGLTAPGMQYSNTTGGASNAGANSLLLTSTEGLSEPYARRLVSPSLPSLQNLGNALSYQCHWAHKLWMIVVYRGLGFWSQ